MTGRSVSATASRMMWIASASSRWRWERAMAALLLTRRPVATWQRRSHFAAMTEPPLRAVIVPVTPLQQNCCLIWCTKTMKGAFTDPGGDLDRLKAAAEQQKVEVEKILLTHGHIDHCGSAKILADELGVPIEGPHEDDRFWISRLEDDGRAYGIRGKPFESDRWLVNGDKVNVGELEFDVYH